jgi:hypothetical protein
MSDDFGFGDAPASPPPHSDPIPVAPPRPITIPVLFVVAGVVAAALAFGFLRLLDRGGEEAAAVVSSALDGADEAADADAQAALRNALAASKVAYVAESSYATLTPAVLAEIEPSYSYTTGASADPRTVSVASEDQVVGLAVRSTSGACFWVRDDAAGEAGSPTVAEATGVTCTGAAALANA